MAKRITFTKAEKELFSEVLRNDRDAVDYILNKGVIRAVDKGELYERLTEKYNSK